MKIYKELLTESNNKKTDIFKFEENDGFTIGVLYSENNDLKKIIEIHYDSKTDDVVITKH